METKHYIYDYYKYKFSLDNTYTYKQAVSDILNKINEKINKKILYFNQNIEYSYDKNNIPKIIHFTLKDKRNIENVIWRECLNEYYKMYPDYKIIIYDDNDIFNIIQYFDKKNIGIVKNIKKGAILADVFRYLILYLRGGYYSDMDCFPIKRIDELSKIQYHGDRENNIYIYQKKVNLKNKEYEFYDNPCNNCRLIFNNLNNSSKIKQIYKCLGHQYINNEQTNIILGFEFEKTWHADLINSNTKNLWTHNNIGICQWFIGAKPQEKLFKKCYKQSLKNITNINLNSNNYHFNVINSTGPLFFTRMINSFLEKDLQFKNKIAILPCDYFCCGSGDTVPSTKNKFIQHKFTGTWLK